MHLLMQSQRGDSVHPVVISRQLAQHLRHVVLRHNLDRAVVRSRHQAHTLVQQPMTGPRRQIRCGMAPLGLVPTPVRIGRSIRASMPTRESMAPSIEPAGDAPCVERRANVLPRSLLPKRRRQGQRAWGDQPTSPLGP